MWKKDGKVMSWRLSDAGLGAVIWKGRARRLDLKFRTSDAGEAEAELDALRMKARDALLEGAQSGKLMEAGALRLYEAHAQVLGQSDAEALIQGGDRF